MKNEDQIKVGLSCLGLGFVTGAIAGAGLAVARGMIRNKLMTSRNRLMMSQSKLIIRIVKL